MRVGVKILTGPPPDGVGVAVPSAEVSWRIGSVRVGMGGRGDGGEGVHRFGAGFAAGGRGMAVRAGGRVKVALGAAVGVSLGAGWARARRRPGGDGDDAGQRNHQRADCQEERTGMFHGISSGERHTADLEGSSAGPAPGRCARFALPPGCVRRT